MMSVPSIPMSMDQVQVQGGPMSQGTYFGGGQFIAVGPGGQALQFQRGAGPGDFGHQPPPFAQRHAIMMQQMQQQFSAQFRVAAPFGQGPPQFGQGPPQYAQGPPQYAQGPPQYAQGPGMPQIAPIPMPMMAMQGPGHGMGPGPGQPQFAQMQQHLFQ